MFFPEAGRTGGERSARVDTQGGDAAHGDDVENVRWTQSQVEFATVHVVGSNNDLQPWFGAAETVEQREMRLAEYEARLAAALDWIDGTFAAAQEHDARAVVLAMQADTIVGTREAVE